MRLRRRGDPERVQPIRLAIGDHDVMIKYMDRVGLHEELQYSIQ